MSKNPNVILITVDQMRGDCLGILGHPVIETPHLDSMAHMGTTFTNAVSAVPSCIAARASIFTGLTQNSHGRVGYQDKVPWNYEHTLAGEFSKAGYHTQCVGKMHVYPARNLCGFNNVVLHDGYLHCNRSYNVPASDHSKNTDDYLPWLRQRIGNEADIIDTGVDCNSWVARPWIYPEYLHPTNWVVEQSIDFLRRKDPTKPFFLMSSFVRPHSPLDPPQYYLDQYINRDIPDPIIGDWAEHQDCEGNGLVYNCTNGIIDRRGLKRARAAYYALITHIDHQIGKLLQALFEYDALNNTIILFTSDHGDLLGDHNLFRKCYPYKGSTSIPFIVYDPSGVLGIKNGQVIDEMIELRDIMPSLLNFAGVDIPDSIEGKSIMPLMNGQNTNWREYIHGEHAFGINSNHFIVSKNEKYIWYSQTGKEQYFDLQNDPLELHDLSNDVSKIGRIDYWRNILVKELKGREEGYTDGNKLINGRKPINCLSHITE